MQNITAGVIAVGLTAYNLYLRYNDRKYTPPPPPPNTLEVTITAAWLAQLVRRQSAVREVPGSIPGRTTTQGLKIIEEKVLPLL